MRPGGDLAYPEGEAVNLEAKYQGAPSKWRGVSMKKFLSKEFLFDRLMGALLVVLGIAVILGWVLHKPIMVQIAPGFVAMVFNTALCFAFGGIALLLPERYPDLRRRGQMLLGGLMILLALAVLAQDIFHRNFGIDQAILEAWLSDSNPNPGRMAPNTAIAFIVSGLILVLLSLPGKWWHITVQVLTFAVLIIGLTGLVGYTLKLESLYGWHQYTRMALHTALGFIIFGAGLAGMWYRSDWYQAQYQGKDEQRIGMVGGAILVTIALTAGLSGFSALEKQNDTLVRNGLQFNLKIRTDLFKTTIEQGFAGTGSITKRPFLVTQMRKLREGNDQTAIDGVQNVAQNILTFSFSAVAFYDRPGKQVAHAGSFIRRPELTIALNEPHTGKLFWSQGLVLQTKMDIVDQGERLGTVIAEQPLPTLTKMFFDFRGLGESGDMVVCAALNQEMQCFPTRLAQKILILPREISQEPLPMSRALAGSSGVVIAQDYRAQKVMAAYSPIGSLGLGMVLKMDIAELYQPIRSQLEKTVPLILVLVLIGVLLLRWQVVPLVRRLVHSEQQARDINAKLTQSEMRTRAVVDHAKDGIMTFDEQGLMESFNPAAADMFGYTPAEVIGKNITMIMPEEMHAAHQRGLRRYLETGAANVVGKDSVEMPGKSKDGSILKIELGISEMRFAERRMFVGILRDITERRREQDELKATSMALSRSNRELQDFASVASHDLQEPLRKVQTFGDRLKAKCADALGEEGRDYLARMQNAAARMQSLIIDLLNFSRVTTNAQAFIQVDLKKVAEEVLSDLEVRITQTKACIELDDLPTINADPLQMRQLLQNLIGNALKFHREEEAPKVKIYSSQLNGHDGGGMGGQPTSELCQIIVEDNGIGFDEKYLDRIFTVFQRLHGREAYEGTGIGLAISRKIAERHGGSITAASRPGQGAKFIVTLLIKQTEGSSAP
jgi:PAS domain S-box-containing protein